MGLKFSYSILWYQFRYTHNVRCTFLNGSSNVFMPLSQQNVSIMKILNMDRLWNISHISAHLHLHCDKSLVVFSAIARSASGSKSYNMELSAVFLPRCSWLYTKLKLGRLPAVAGNIPWFDFMNLLLHILICGIKILIFSQDNINYGVKIFAHAHSDHKQAPWLHYTKETLLVYGIFGSYTIKSWPIEPGIYVPAMAGKTKLVKFPAISGKIPCYKGIEAGQYFSAIAGNVRSYCR